MSCMAKMIMASDITNIRDETIMSIFSLSRWWSSLE